MDTNDRDEVRDGGGAANQADEHLKTDPAAATIIGANIAGNNTAPFPGGVAAPAAGLAAEEAGAEESGAINFDALERFGSAHRQTGDSGVSEGQSELEADELNG